MTARGTWKAFERAIASGLNGKRIPVTGVDRHGADVVTPMFHCQVKLRKSLPNWIFDWLHGIRGTTPDGKIGILILRTPRMRNADALVVMTYAEFVDLHGETKARDTITNN